MAQAPPPPPTLVAHAQRNLPTTTSITPCACCPTRDLLALLSSTSASTSTNDASTSTSNSGKGKLSLYRTTGQIDHVWDFAPSPSPSTVAAAVAPTAPVSKFAAFGTAKAKAKAVQVGVDAIAWSPDGHHLAVLSSSSPPPGTTLSNLEIVALHQPIPKPLLPPTSIPSNGELFSKPSHLAWHPLTTVKKPEPSPENLPDRRPPHPEWTYRPLRSSAQALIEKLPALPDLNASNASTALIGATDPNSSSGSGSVAAGAGGGPGAARAAIFGAKNAMLQKEREKDMGKPLILNEAAPRFPTLLEESRAKGEQGQGSVLVVGQGGGKVTIYYGGSVMLGTVDVGEGLDQVQVHGSTTLPWDETEAGTALRNPPRGTFRISLLVSSNDPADPTSRDWRDRQIKFDLPPTLHLLMTQSTELHRHISHAFEALQSVRTLWDEARRLGKSWLSRISEMSKAHSITTSPITQLLLLLLTGRPSAALHDFLASKMNEKSLSKWQGSMAQVLQRLKSVPYMSLQPAIERTVLLWEEVESWAMWKEKWGAFGLELGEVRRCLRLGTGVVKACARLERVVVEEERCFEAFGAWLHYELEKVAAQEGSEIVPIANFTPLPVAYYIRHCLPVDVNSILPFLNFGPFSASLDTNVDLIRSRRWIDQLEVVGKRGKTREEGEEELRSVSKRMKEELKGQITAERVEAMAEDGEGTLGGWDKEGLLGAEGLEPPSKPGDDAMGDDVVPPTAPGSANKAKLGEDDISVSLPILLHLLAERVARMMDQAITAVGAPRVQEKPLLNPESSGVEVITGTSRAGVLYREQTVRNDVWRVWIDGEVFRVVKSIYSTHTEALNIQLGALARLVDERDRRLQVIDLAWLDLDELVMICRIHEGKVTSHYLLSVCMSALSFEPLASNPCRATPIQDSPTQRIPLHRTLLFEPQFPPEGLSIQPYREEEDGSTCRSGAPVACVLAGDGRRLQVVVIEGGSLGDYDEEGDEEML
ncbi:BZ3500_MvSof-1268-A1-R1_Chr1-3g02404 [Microbotryum saponariae]|uniref:Anaphase-promoting complex subunit 4 n=1 Tax=Microbotryum saponariae TaxID=289078 RepID=A0A2X0KX91_9BASI|nr:BZ3500_MvSof-1268-A1-R1_Chr1-3g02404 [Microbotryum saponariae]SCZ96191.1 BZ3501_MvSof-1269-A2-R1_Chr1-3g02007 [Microbotryum saponariae]